VVPVKSQLERAMMQARKKTTMEAIKRTEAVIATLSEAARKVQKDQRGGIYQRLDEEQCVLEVLKAVVDEG